MAVKIRLRQQGRANRQTYRLVVCDPHVKRDGKYLENLGWYDPYLKETNAHVHADRAAFWLSQGAEMSPDAKTLIARVAPHVIKEWNAKREAKKVKEAAKRRDARKKKAAATK